MLSRVHPSHLDDYYSQHIRPLKTRMDVRYMCRATFWSDFAPDRRHIPGLSGVLARSTRRSPRLYAISRLPAATGPAGQRRKIFLKRQFDPVFARKQTYGRR